MIPVPVLTPHLSSLWLGLVTPIYARVGRKLIESMRNPTLVRDKSALTAFNIRPMGLRAAVERALHHENLEYAATFWSDALSSAANPRPGRCSLRTRLVDSRTIHVSVHPPWPSVHPADWRRERMYFASFLWQIRGFFDLLVGGVGLRRVAVILAL